jgi:hypothetical protein
VGGCRGETRQGSRLAVEYSFGQSRYGLGGSRQAVHRGHREAVVYHTRHKAVKTMRQLELSVLGSAPFLPGLLEQSHSPCSVTEEPWVNAQD